MNVYDFDGTIYNGDSSLDLYLFSLRKNLKLIRFLPIQLCGILRYKLNICSKEEMKTSFFSFMKGINGWPMYVKEFWDKNESLIKKWYLVQHKIDDVIISASPEFLLKDICTRLGINKLIATRVDPSNGKLISKNCYGIEKTRRFRANFPIEKIDSFYSDSISDHYMAELANNAFFVDRDSVILWTELKK